MNADFNELLSRVTATPEVQNLMSEVNKMPSVKKLQNEYAVNAAKTRVAGITPIQWALIAAGIVGVIWFIRKV